MKFVDVKTDFAFKKIFGDEKHKSILISFLNSVLQPENNSLITDIQILNPFQTPKLEMLKETILDISCRDKLNNEYIVEMQVFNTPALEKRILYYTSKRYSEQLSRGEDYPKLNQVIFIGILNFNLFKDKPGFKSIHKIMDIETYRTYFKDFIFLLIELKKFEKELKDLSTIEEKWYYFIKHAENLELKPEELSKEDAIREAMDLAEQTHWTKEELEILIKRQIYIQDEIGRVELARKEGIEQGIQQGIQQGILQDKLEIAKKLVEEGIKLDLITKITGLSKNEIQENN